MGDLGAGRSGLLATSQCAPGRPVLALGEYLAAGAAPPPGITLDVADEPAEAEQPEAAKELDGAIAHESSLERLGEQLISAQALGHAWKRRFHRPVLVVVLVVFPISGVMSWMGDLSRSPTMLYAGLFLGGLGGHGLLLLVLPTDRTAIKWVARAWLALIVAIVLQDVATTLMNTGIQCCSVSGVEISRGLARAHVAFSCAASLGWLCILAWFARRMRERPARVLQGVWSSIGAAMCVLGVYVAVERGLIWALQGAPGPFILSSSVLFAYCAAVAAFCRRTRLRAAAQSFLARRAGQSAPLAHIAELLGQRPIRETIEAASATFRCVTADRVTLESLSANSPDASLRACTEHAQFGEVDAFVSHSWHDDPAPKWAALQRWRAEFVKRCGREPRLWVDRFCIDPANLDDGLRCLPLYVAGCTTFLVLCGPTYLQRAWCLLEIFVFIAIGGAVDDVDVRFFMPSAPDLEKVVAGFDAAQAKCTFEQDTARLQDIFMIELGSARTFTDVVRTVFRQRSLN